MRTAAGGWLGETPGRKRTELRSSLARCGCVGSGHSKSPGPPYPERVCVRCQVKAVTCLLSRLAHGRHSLTSFPASASPSQACAQPGSPAPLCRRESETPSPDLTLPDLISRCPVPALPADSLLLKVKTCSCPGASAQVVPSAWRAVCPLGCPPAAIYYIQLVTSSLGLSRPFHLDLQCALAPFRSNIMYGLCIYFCCLFSAIRM